MVRQRGEQRAAQVAGRTQPAQPVRAQRAAGGSAVRLRGPGARLPGWERPGAESETPATRGEDLGRGPRTCAPGGPPAVRSRPCSGPGGSPVWGFGGRRASEGRGGGPPGWAAPAPLWVPASQPRPAAASRVFFDACDGFFTNYNWREEHLERMRGPAGGRRADVYVGVDVFARSNVVGGQFDTHKVGVALGAAEAGATPACGPWPVRLLRPGFPGAFVPICAPGDDRPRASQSRGRRPRTPGGWAVPWNPSFRPLPAIGRCFLRGRSGQRLLRGAALQRAAPPS